MHALCAGHKVQCDIQFKEIYDKLLQDNTEEINSDLCLCKLAIDILRRNPKFKP